MTKSQFFILCLVSLIFTSCAIHSGNVNNSQIPQSSKGIVYKDKVYGYASCHYILGIGGLGSQGLAAEAVFNLKNGVELEAGEYLDNFTIDHRRFYFVPFYMQHEVLVTADKILDLDQKKVSYEEEYTKQNRNFDAKNKKSFALNEKVFARTHLGSYAETTIIKHLNQSVKVISMMYNGKLKRNRLRYDKIFKKDAQGDNTFFLTAKEGDTVAFNEDSFGVFYLKKGVFLGSNNSKILLKDVNSYSTYIFDFDKIIIEDSTQARKEKLNQEIAKILKSSNQKVIGKNNGKLIYGEFTGFEGNDVLIQLENSNEAALIDIDNVYTIENWLELSTKKVFRKKLRVGEKVTYNLKTNTSGLASEVLGFRYHRVLIRTDDGKVLDVPIGKLNI